MKEIDVFHSDEDRDNFDSYGHSNGIDFWYARDLMEFLGYDDYKKFNTVVQRAIATCVTVGVDIVDTFIPIKRTIGGEELPDYKLSRFACFLVSMNGDPKKERVAEAQVYFIHAAETRLDYLEESENVERVIMRNEIADSEKSLGSVAGKHGVINWPLFQNAGYRGMYNMNLNELKRYKQMRDEKRTLLDFMGKEELAANLFRITQTEAKIKNEDVHGQSNLEVAAETVGKVIRQTIIDISQTPPEDLKLAEDIKKVRSRLKNTNRHLKQLRIIWPDKDGKDITPYSCLNPYSRRRWNPS